MQLIDRVSVWDHRGEQHVYRRLPADDDGMTDDLSPTTIRLPTYTTDGAADLCNYRNTAGREGTCQWTESLMPVIELNSAAASLPLSL